MFQSDAAPPPVADVDPLEAAAGPAPAGDSALIAETAGPESFSGRCKSPSSTAGPSVDAAPPANLDAATPEKPAAHWDRATGAVRFDWTAIERIAAQHGPNQAMAKLLVAARAEGANSRWPF